MSKWRSRALKALPEFSSAIQSADSQGALWSELFMHFIAHYDVDRLPTVNAPSNLIRRINLVQRRKGLADWRDS
jgi:hypothetical protein